MSIRYPRPLRPGDVIGVTAPSSGVEPELRPRLDFAVEGLRMDTPYDVPQPLLSWLDVTTLPQGATFTLSSPGVQGRNHWNWADNPRATEYTWTGTGTWRRHDGDGPVEVTGRLVGGCIETLCNLAGFFDAATAVRVGRTRAPDTRTLSQYDAVLDALGGLGVPLVVDVECGHVPPYLPLVNGALGRLQLDGEDGSLTQTLA
jgi:muramoyltetrapeptide carboxypeptidase LdcA involved in peptidoglycan recycling